MQQACHACHTRRFRNWEVKQTQILSLPSLQFSELVSLVSIKHTPTFPEALGRGGQGGGRPSNLLQNHFSNYSNSGLKIAGGGGVRPMILAIIMCTSTGFYNLATSVAFSHDLYGIDSNFFLVAKPAGSHSTYPPSLHISTA